MIFADYQLLVFREYEKKRVAGGLSRRMTRFTPAKLKEECEAVYNQRYERKDEKTLEEFFAPSGDHGVSLRAIRDCNPNKFRPLVNFLNGKTRWPDEIIIELLAWLIDFRPRPYEFGRKNDTNRPDIPAIEQDEREMDSDEKVVEAGPADGSSQNEKKGELSPGGPIKKVPRFGKRKIIIAAIVLAVTMAGVYWAWRISPTVDKSEPEACMYWTGDHYTQVSCGQKLGDTLMIPLNPEKLLYFKKISRPDTITENALGSVWYVNFRGTYECYTSPGYHPIDTGLKLRPLTDYVLIKHIHPGQKTEKTSK